MPPAKLAPKLTPKGRRKPRLFNQTTKKHGLPPGTLVHIGDIHAFKPYVNVMRFSQEHFTEVKDVPSDKVRSHLSHDHVTWIDVEGLHDLNLIKQVCDTFEIHPLIQEDIVNTSLRPQFETYGEYYFFTLKMLYIDPERQCLKQEHVSLLLKGDLVLTFQEIPGDVFIPIRDRIRQGTGRIRSRGGDYLTYTILDAIVDGYYRVVDNMGERLEALEEQMRRGLHPDQAEQIYDLKRELLFLRKTIFPVRDMISKTSREISLFQDTSRIYLKDLSDHAQQVSESLMTFTELANVLLDSYHAMMNQKMNNIFKVLTMISTVFLPLNFVAGIYGMNFEHMPELHEPYAYPIVLGVMVLIVLVMLAFFVKKRWIWEYRQLKK